MQAEAFPVKDLDADAPYGPDLSRGQSNAIMPRILSAISGYAHAKHAYYGLGTLKRRIRNRLSPTARILLYHRVADVERDPHLLCVNPTNFRAQIAFLRGQFTILPLGKLVQDIRRRQIERGAIVITFDDGYADNLHSALPVLKEFQVPTTIFLTANHIGDYLTPDEARMLSAEPLIEIGAHTITHPKLASLSEDEQYNEIAGSKALLEKRLNISLLSFAYPFGSKDSFSERTIEMVKKAGFACACANIRERVTNTSDVYSLPRFAIRNWDIDEFKENVTKFA